MPTDRPRRRQFLLVEVVACIAMLGAAGCTSTPSRPVADAPPTVAADTPAPASAERLAASFIELAATIPATVGLAVVPVGGSTITSFGVWSTGVAWSTIKVPLAIAALRVEPPDSKQLAAKAITESDNAAAEQLWSRLGPPEQAARQVQQILREGGDTSTTVESHRLRPGFTAFGQTQWPLGRQAQFAAQLTCLSSTGGVVDLMHQLIAGQRWGLAADGAAAKGGWGPGVSSGYLVRQFAVVATTGGDAVGVALAAEPRDGSFAGGVAALDRMARWLGAHRSELPGGSCAE